MSIVLHHCIESYSGSSHIVGTFSRNVLPHIQISVVTGFYEG